MITLALRRLRCLSTVTPRTDQPKLAWACLTEVPDPVKARIDRFMSLVDEYGKTRVWNRIAPVFPMVDPDVDGLSDHVAFLTSDIVALKQHIISHNRDRASARSFKLKCRRRKSLMTELKFMDRTEYDAVKFAITPLNAPFPPSTLKKKARRKAKKLHFLKTKYGDDYIGPDPPPIP